MEKKEYNELIENKEFDRLSKIDYLIDLVHYQYQGKYLIEYLLEQGIHSEEMDKYTIYNNLFTGFYLKYNITKPLLKCHLKTLLRTNDGKLMLEELLSKIDREDQLELYRNLKINSYWDLHEYEDFVISIYKKFSIELPKVFIKRFNIIDHDDNENKKNNLLLEDFKYYYSDHNSMILDVLLSEFNHGLEQDKDYTIYEIKELIKYKKDNPSFRFELTSAGHCSYNKEKELMEISPYRRGVLNHEISHLLFETNEKDNFETISEYEKLCDSINQEEVIERIVNYLSEFHRRYDEVSKTFEKLYYRNLKDKYNSYDDYIKAICKDILKYKVNEVATEYDVKEGFYITEDNIEEIVIELLITEKQEFIKSETKNYFTYELMVESLLDAILHGRILDELLDIKCLSGHSYFQFSADYSLSFNECLADYSAIKSSPQGDRLINDLRMLIGDEIIDLLDNYLEKNRRGSYGH